MGGRSAVLRNEFGGNFTEGEVCGVLAFRRILGQPGLAGRVSCADLSGVQLEREGFAAGPWSAVASARGQAARLQKREISAADYVCRFAEECGRWERLCGARGRIFLVRRDLTCGGRREFIRAAAADAGNPLKHAPTMPGRLHLRQHLTIWRVW